MIVQVQKSGDTFSFTLSPQVAEEFSLVDGASVELYRTEAGVLTMRYASVDDVMRIHRKLEPNHADAYAELAK